VLVCWKAGPYSQEGITASLTIPSQEPPHRRNTIFPLPQRRHPIALGARHTISTIPFGRLLALSADHRILPALRRRF
jgi:hypothetical protein